MRTKIFGQEWLDARVGGEVVRAGGGGRFHVFVKNES